MHQSKYSFTPKIHAALSLIRDILLRQEQVVVFSALHDPTDVLGRYLSEAGIRFQIMDGRHAPDKRSDSSKAFKQKRFPVLLCGAESCAEGHSWPQANNVIMLCYSWALDKMLQSVNRVHRINSEADVNAYYIVADGSVDLKLQAMLTEKSDASDLVLDGQLLGEDPSEVNLAELLQIAQQDFANCKAAGTLDERELEKAWPPLRAQLAGAMRLWERPVLEGGSNLDARRSTPISALSPPPSGLDLHIAPLFAELPLWRRAFKVGTREVLQGSK